MKTIDVNFIVFLNTLIFCLVLVFISKNFSELSSHILILLSGYFLGIAWCMLGISLSKRKI